MNTLKIYFAGKVSPGPASVPSWRESFCVGIALILSNTEIINMDPTKHDPSFDLNESDSHLMFGRDVFMISQADLVVVNLTDDISVGGSQEMLIAKMYKKYLIGVAPWGGKFRKKTTVIRGREFKNWIHPFVEHTCDIVVEDVAELAQTLRNWKGKSIKTIQIVEEMRKNYEKEYLPSDIFVQNVINPDQNK